VAEKAENGEEEESKAIPPPLPFLDSLLTVLSPSSMGLQRRDMLHERPMGVMEQE
jgi:hypothetical protein